MDRRGSLEWMFENIGRLVLGIAVFALVLYLMFELVTLFVGDYSQNAASRQLDLLSDRIAAVQYQHLSGTPEASVFITPSTRWLIVPLSAGMQNAKDCGETAFDMPRPRSCKDRACLCLYDLDANKTVRCNPVDAQTIALQGRLFASNEPVCELGVRIEGDHRVHAQSIRISVSGDAVTLLFSQEPDQPLPAVRPA